MLYNVYGNIIYNRTLKLPKWPLIEDGIKKLRCIHTTEYYLAIMYPPTTKGRCLKELCTVKQVRMTKTNARYLHSRLVNKAKYL